MILMWLAPVVVMVGGLILFRKGVAQAAGVLQRKFLKLPTPTSTASMLFTTVLCAVGMGS